MIITSPVLLIVAICIKAYDHGPVFLFRKDVRWVERFSISINSEV